MALLDVGRIFSNNDRAHSGFQEISVGRASGGERSAADHRGAELDRGIEEMTLASATASTAQSQQTPQKRSGPLNFRIVGKL